MDVIDGYGKSASPCPSETTHMAPRYSDPMVYRDLVLPDCQSRTPWTWVSTSYAGLQKAYVCNRYFRFNKIQKKPAQSWQAECCQKKSEKKCLTIFWYSPTNRYAIVFIIHCDIAFIPVKLKNRCVIYIYDKSGSYG